MKDTERTHAKCLACWPPNSMNETVRCCVLCAVCGVAHCVLLLHNFCLCVHYNYTRFYIIDTYINIIILDIFVLFS